MIYRTVIVAICVLAALVHSEESHDARALKGKHGKTKSPSASPKTRFLKAKGDSPTESPFVLPKGPKLEILLENEAVNYNNDEFSMRKEGESNQRDGLIQMQLFLVALWHLLSCI